MITIRIVDVITLCIKSDKDATVGTNLLGMSPPASLYIRNRLSTKVAVLRSEHSGRAVNHKMYSKFRVIINMVMLDSRRNFF